ncbi:MAG: hypothetical protein IH897_11410 [Planctomycetes bacterium]|nr:hypothetical protein [Planctomycetota bacterium]
MQVDPRIALQLGPDLRVLVGSEGVETRVVDSVLQIRSENRMMGYLNAPWPFNNGWSDTGDLVEEDGDYIKVVGRTKEVINVGGLKFLPTDIERVAPLHPDVLHAKAVGVGNAITGQHIEIICQLRPGFSLDRRVLREHFRQYLAGATPPPPGATGGGAG